MRLNADEMIQIEGIYARNPITNIPTDLLQYFLVTRDQDGETLDPAVLFPRCEERDPIPMTRLARISRGTYPYAPRH